MFQTKSLINSLVPQINTNQTTETIGEKIQDFIGSIISPFAKSFGDKINDNYESLISRKKTFDEKASNALRKIEIIMGECSGLGLCDILAIIAALYTMPKDKLIGFLDDDAFDRAKQIFKAEEIIFLDSKPTIDESLESFTNVVKDYYILMDKMLSDFEIYNNRRS